MRRKFQIAKGPSNAELRVLEKARGSNSYQIKGNRYRAQCFPQFRQNKTLPETTGKADGGGDTCLNMCCSPEIWQVCVNNSMVRNFPWTFRGDGLRGDAHHKASTSKSMHPKTYSNPSGVIHVIRWEGSQGVLTKRSKCKISTLASFLGDPPQTKQKGGVLPGLP